MLWIWRTLIWPMAIHEWMEYGTVRINSPHRPTQRRLLEESKPRRDKEPKAEDSISGSDDRTHKLLHYTVYALSNTRTEILKFSRNWTIIFIIEYFTEFSWVFCAFCSKNFIILGIFMNILLSKFYSSEYFLSNNFFEKNNIFQNISEKLFLGVSPFLRERRVGRQKWI